MPFNLGTAVYNFQVSGLSQGVSQLNSFHANLQLLQRGNFLGPLSGGFSRLNGVLGSLISRIGIMSAATSALTAIGGGLGIGGAIGLAAEMEQVEKSMEVFLGSADKAKELVGDLKSFSAQTPLEFPGVLKASQSLLAGNVAAKDLVSTLRMIGDVAFPLRGAAGVEHLAQVYATFKSQGQITKQDVNQFAFMGIPIWEALAKVTGTTTQNVRKLVSDGKIGFPEMHNALVSLTSEGGRFHNMMMESSTTLKGRWSTFIDIFRTDVIAKLGERIISVFRLPQLLEQAIGYAESFSTRFGPAIDGYLIKLRQVMIESLPIIRVAAMIGEEYLKAAFTITKNILPVIQGIARWMERNETLVRTVTQVVIWTYALNTAIGLGTTAVGLFGTTSLTAAAKTSTLGTSVLWLKSCIDAMNASAQASAVVVPASIAKWSSATALPIENFRRASMLSRAGGMVGRLGMGGGLAGGLALTALGAYGASQINASRVARMKIPQQRPWDERTQRAAEMVADRMGFRDRQLTPKVPGSQSSGYPSPIAGGGAGGLGAARTGANRAAFVGISELAERMQISALNAAQDKLMEEHMSKTAAATETLASAVDGSRLRVKFEDIASVPTTYGRP